MKAVAELIWTGSYGATTIDQICEKAGVKKGSFYYFFDSKSAVAEAAITVEWENYRPRLDRIFSATVPPLLRLQRYCQHECAEQAQLKSQFGHVLGCPLCTLGAEVSTQDSGLRKQVQAIMDQARRYFESAIRDAHAAGLINAPDPAAKARCLYAYCEGLLTQARIADDVAVLREMERGMFDVLGVRESTAGPN